MGAVEPVQSGSAIIQFARWPVLGQVKTRLARTLGLATALQAHRDLVSTCLAVVSACPAGHKFLYWDRTTGQAEWPEEMPRPIEVQVGCQSDEDLGVRMLIAMQEVQRLTGAERLVLVGSDCPVLTQVLLQDALDTLDSNGAVLIPAEDGGYVLIGLRAENLKSGLLDGISWGTNQVLQQTLDRFEAHDVSCRCLEPLWDVDEEPDYWRWKRLKPETLCFETKKPLD